MVLSNKIYDNTEVNVKYSDPKTFSQIDRSTNFHMQYCAILDLYIN